MWLSALLLPPLWCSQLVISSVSSTPSFSSSCDQMYRSNNFRNNVHTTAIVDNQRRRSLSALLSTRGGSSPMQSSSDFYSNDDEDDEFLDSIFLNDDKLTNSVREKSPMRYERSKDTSLYSANQVKRNPSIEQQHKHQQQRQQQQIHEKIQLERRKEMLFNLAMSMQDTHTSTIQALIKGNAAHIPPALFGQTISQEKAACNEKFHDIISSNSDNIDFMEELKAIKNGQAIEEETPGPSFRHIEDPNLLSYWGLTPDAMLYGGAQYHRVLRYYHHLLLTAPLPEITDDEVALLSNSITDIHDASDLMRAVALLVQQKMELVMEDILADMTRRLLYVMERQWELVEYSMTLHRPMGSAGTGFGKSGDKLRRESRLYSRYGPEFTAAEQDLMRVLSTSFHKFARERAADTHRKSAEDIKALLRYVTWDMGRARTRDARKFEYQKNGGGYVTEIQIIREDHSISDELPGEAPADLSANEIKTPRKNKRKKKSIYSEETKRRMVARGGAAIGSGRKRSQLRRDEENESASSEKAKQDDSQIDDIAEEDDSVSTSLVLRSQTSPMFSGDDEVLSLLFDTLSTTLISKSERQAGQTQAAIENMTSYITDRMRLDLSRMIRSKFNTFFLLPFYEDLGIYLRRELDDYLESLAA